MPQASHKPELLSPVGGPEAGHAALDYGADAIYLGLKKFSARSDAVNFSSEELSEIVAYAHSLEPRRKVYITLNTLVYENELPEIIDTLFLLSDLEVDGIIVQDLGVAKIAREFFPELKLHASTQLAIHNLEGAVMAKRIGFSRVNLARELTIEEIEEITKKSGLEVEVFIHGALCYSYSGLCLFSAMERGRSGNRGECAQVCRETFSFGKREGLYLPFSMKDLALPDLIPVFQKIGVKSLKIEGRKKSPLYVAAVTDFYRKILDGNMTPKKKAELEDNMKMIFSRPWTDLYFKERENKSVIDTEFTGHRGIKIGIIEKVFRRPDGRAVIRFLTSRALEKHDGLQIEIPKFEKPFGFPVEFLQPDRKTKFFNVSAGLMVDIVLPKNSPFIKKGLEVFCSSSQAVKRKYAVGISKPGKIRVTRKLDFTLTLSKHSLNVRAVIKASGNGEKDAFVSCETLENFPYAKDPAEMERSARETFEKLGGTQFTLNSFSFNNPYKLFVPVSKLNQIRRQVIKEASKKIEKMREEKAGGIKEKVLASSSGTVKETGKKKGSGIIIKADRLQSLGTLSPENAPGAKEIIVDISKEETADLWTGIPALEKIVGEGNLRLAIPPITRFWEREALKEKIQKLLEKGYYKWQVSNLSGFELLSHAQTKSSKIKLSADWPLYVTNHLSAKVLFELGCQKVTLAPENSIENLKSLAGILGERAEVIAYHDTPLFISESCPKAAIGGKCPRGSPCDFGEIKVESSKLGRFIIVSDNCRTTVVSEEPFEIFGRLKELERAGAVNFRVDFINRNYPPKKAIDVIKDKLFGF
jgi:putative protease